MTRLLTIIVSTLISTNGICQSNKNFISSQRLFVGDKVPDILLKSIVKNTDSTISINRLNKKLIILDFWSKYCSACISAFPKMDSLQVKYRNEIQILLVAPNTRAELNQLFKTSNNLKKTNLPLVLGDTMLHKYFPHIGVPYHVWIDRNGKVIATTDGESTTEGNIDKYISRNQIKLPERNDELDDKLREVNLLDQSVNSQKQSAQLKSYSILTGINLLDNRSSIKLLRDTLKKTIGLKYLNFSLLQLIDFAYSANNTIDKILLDSTLIADSTLFYPPADRDKYVEWKYQSWYCYEAVVPELNFHEKHLTVAAYFGNMLLQDINRIFNIHFKLEKRLIESLTISIINNEKLIYHSNETPDIKVIDGNTFVIKNSPISTIANVARYVSGQEKLMVKDESRSTENISITLEDIYNLNDLKTALYKKGIALTDGVAEGQCLIISR